jgi:hypothetical protein
MRVRINLAIQAATYLSARSSAFHQLHTND